MATNPAPQLPILYNDLEPVSRQAHGDKKLKPLDTLPALASVNAVPLTVDEFGLAQRYFPIAFSLGDDPVPLALLGLHDGANVFFDDKGAPLLSNLYIPAYIRRYPFTLARLDEASDQLSLCFDPTAGAVVDGEGDPMFTGDEPSAEIKAVLDFCEQFEQAAQRTKSFVAELKAMDLLTDGEVAIAPDGETANFIYRGFQMVDEEKFRNLSGDKLRKINQSGILPLVIAHLFSMTLVRDLFHRHVQLGNGPAVEDLEAAGVIRGA